MTTATMIEAPERVFGYLGKDGALEDWNGNRIGTYVVVSTWRTPRSYVSSTYSQVEALVNGIRYTGRSAGLSMSYSGKRKA